MITAGGRYCYATRRMASILHIWGVALTAAAMGYALVALIALAARHRPHAASASSAAALQPPVTVLKPLCGAEPHLYECLRSFCEQHYPRYQIVCGVRDPHDAAVGVVEQLKRELPHVSLELVIDAHPSSGNQKVSSLIAMLVRAQHRWLVIADSDVRVTSDYLARVVAPLNDAGVGIVTCPYRGLTERGMWSVLGCAFVNDWFMPSVFVAALFGSRAFAFGATIALRRDSLEAIGGFERIAQQLADDYRLGELTRRNGLRTVLSELMVETYMHEPTLRALLRHELRWLRTIRSVQPLGYACAFVTFALPVAGIGFALSGGGRGAGLMLAVTGVARVMLHFAVRDARAGWAHLWLLIPNDLLAFSLWCWGFLSRRVHWRQMRYRIGRDGSVQPL